MESIWTKRVNGYLWNFVDVPEYWIKPLQIHGLISRRADDADKDKFHHTWNTEAAEQIVNSLIKPIRALEAVDLFSECLELKAAYEKWDDLWKKEEEDSLYGESNRAVLVAEVSRELNAMQHHDAADGDLYRQAGQVQLRADLIVKAHGPDTVVLFRRPKQE